MLIDFQHSLLKNEHHHLIVETQDLPVKKVNSVQICTPRFLRVRGLAAWPQQNLRDMGNYEVHCCLRRLVQCRESENMYRTTTQHSRE